MDELKIKMYSFTLDCKDTRELAEFYAALLDWEIGSGDDDEYTWIYPPGTHHGAYPGILFQKNSEYKHPVWPDEPHAQQQMAHIDFAVNDLEKAVEKAIRCGARVADVQFSDRWRVMFDPAGHPFCLCLFNELFNSSHFALL